jgi:hypothetical protein
MIQTIDFPENVPFREWASIAVALLRSHEAFVQVAGEQSLDAVLFNRLTVRYLLLHSGPV